MAIGAKAGPTKHPALRYVVRRVGWGLLVLWLASLLIFWGTAILPGNAARTMLGRDATPAKLQALEAELRLDESLPQQYWRWVSHAARGDLGRSATSVIANDTQSSIASTIGQRLNNSAVLAAVTALFLVPLALLLGALCASRPGGPFDVIIGALTVGAIALPEFVVASLLIAVFAVALGWFPPVSLISPGQLALESPDMLVLPVATLLTATLALAVRMVRAGMIEVNRSEYVVSAQLGGVSRWRIRWSYAMRNALAPSVQVFALCLTYLVGGIVLTETVFNYPGIGALLVNAVNLRDLTMVQSVALILAAICVVTNIVADLIVIFLVPKLRTAL
jgi:peptide/nickel transport system permease protein